MDSQTQTRLALTRGIKAARAAFNANPGPMTLSKMNKALAAYTAWEDNQRTRTNKSIEARLAGERFAIRRLCQMARAKGWPPLAVDNMGEVIYTTSDREVLEHVFSVDESRIEFMGPEGKKAVALIVLGNSPSEVVADHSIRPGFSELMDEFFEWSEATLTD